MEDDPSHSLFASGIVEAGTFRCGVAHPRFHDTRPLTNYAFVFPRTAVWIQHEGRREFVADANVAPLYNPGRPYRRRRLSDDGDQTDWFEVAPHVLRDVIGRYDPRLADRDAELFDADYAPVSARTYLEQRQVIERLTSDIPADSLFVEEAVLGLLSDLIAGVFTPPATGVRIAHRDLVERARAHLDVTFASSDGLVELAQALSVSEYHLCRLFKRHTGLTIHAYRRQLRLRRSLELLVEPRSDLLTVALDLGFSGHSHFSAAFRATFGLRPTDVRGLSRARQVLLNQTLDHHLRRLGGRPPFTCQSSSS
ncbi:MAG TPA: AraC family transcriptional regulator [Vicinamibacterales bacterium]|nr:AraC family transcriptional regulator [Vicinamibacterales bacterium]